MSLKKIRDRWSFLAEIEAPMWVDLALESENYNQDASEEDWFNTTHQFHQCSSRHLKSTIFHPREGTVASGFDLQSPFSPKLPSSVSRSRGKDYRGKNLESHNPHQRQSKEVHGKKSLFSEPGNQEEMRLRSSMRQSKGSSILTAILDGEGGSYHPLKAVCTSKSSTTNRVNSFTSTRNSRTSNVSEKNQLQQQRSHSMQPAATFTSSTTSKFMSSRSIKNSISSSIHSEKNHPQQQSSHQLKSASFIRISASIGVNSASPNDSGTSTNTADHNLPNPQEEQDTSSRLCDGSTSSGNSGTSNITFESTQPQQQKPLHVPGQAFGNTSERLAVLRSTLRKSCVRRQASRLELQSDVAQTRGSGSSSRKSSVSSLSNPCGDVSSSRLMATRRNGSTTPESRYAVRNDRTTKSLIIFRDAPKKPVASIEERKADSSNGGGTKYAKPAGATVTKSKGQLKTTHARALQPLREKKQQSSLSSTENKGSTRPSKLKTSTTIGKENAIGKAAISTSCKGKSNTNAHLSCGQKGKEQHILADSKAKLNAQNDGRAYKDGTQKVARFESCSTKKSIPR